MNILEVFVSVGLFPKTKNDQLLVTIATLVAILVSYFVLWHPDKLDEPKSLPRLGKIVTKGGIRLRHARTLKWGDVQTEEPVFLMDIVYVPRDSQAEVWFANNRRVTLEPDSMVQFDEVTLDAIEITLFEGKVKGDVVVVSKPKAVAAPERRSVYRLLPYPKTVRAVPQVASLDSLVLRQSELSDRVTKALKKKFNFAKTKPVSVPEITLDRLADYDIRLVKPEVDNYNLKVNRWLEMEWTEVPLAGTDYELQISRDQNFVRAINHETDKNKISIQLDDEATYYWRVIAKNGKQKKLSETRKFTMSNRGGRGTMLDFRLPAEQPTGFLLEVSQDEKFKEILSSEVSSGIRCATKGLKRGQYYCRIRKVETGQVKKVYPFTVK